ncbi:MAG: ATP-dependent RecD-like DNA helicase [Thermaurantimonas sp.]|uniref:ATP-dependent DNA helicase n=1 Tax=Thermaurantimonas sp. TaxID=2681568 RepID=UPI00391B59E9
MSKLFIYEIAGSDKRSLNAAIYDGQNLTGLFLSNQLGESLVKTLIVGQIPQADLIYYACDGSDNPQADKLLDGKFVINLKDIRILRHFKVSYQPELTPTAKLLKILYQKLNKSSQEPELSTESDILDMMFQIANVYNLKILVESVREEINDQQFNDFITRISAKLSEEQREALGLIFKFMNSPEHRIFILRGAAGTGKTTLARYILEMIGEIFKENTVSLMAPTGKASRNISEKTGKPANTIHKKIYSMKVGVSITESDNKPIDDQNTDEDELSLIQITTLNQNFGSHVGIVDEASMLSDLINDDEIKRKIFEEKKKGRIYKNCTGFTLRDLIGLCIKDNVKIILIGDIYQLPPIETGEPFGLSPEFITQKYEIHTMMYELSMPHRFKQDNSILEFSLYLRDKIQEAKNKNFSIKYLVNDFRDKNSIRLEKNITINYNDLNDLVKKFIEIYQKNKDVAVVTWSNNAADFCNYNIRKSLNYEDIIEKNDRLICVQNNYNYEIYNGDILFVNEIKKCEISLAQYFQLNIGVLIPYFDLNIRILNSDDKYMEVKTQMETNVETEVYKFFSIPKKGVRQEFKINQRLANYKYFYNRVKFKFCEEITNEKVFDIKKQIEIIRSNKEDFINYVNVKAAIDPYLNALYIKYAYAFTCHKAQGSEWENVILTNLNNKDLRWLYTATTRAKEHLYIYPKAVVSSSGHKMPLIFMLGRNFNGYVSNTGMYYSDTLVKLLKILIKTPDDLPIEYHLPEAIRKNLNTEYLALYSGDNVVLIEKDRISPEVLKKFEILRLNSRIPTIRFGQSNRDGQSIAYDIFDQNVNNLFN